MDVTPLIPAGRQVINAYGDGGFRIAGIRHPGSVLVLAEQTLAWPVAALAEVTLDSLRFVREARPRIEILLLGCGAAMAALDPGLRAALRAEGIGVDCMDTGAACRTFNVLLSEERRAAAALIAVS